MSSEGPGRPKVGPMLRVKTPQEIEEIAKRHGLTVSEYLHSMVMDEIRRDRDREK